MDLHERMTRVEEQLMHQQHFVQQLNEVIIELRTELDAATKKLQKSDEQIEWLLQKQEDGLPNEKPPHY